MGTVTLRPNAVLTANLGDGTGPGWLEGVRSGSAAGNPGRLADDVDSSFFAAYSTIGGDTQSMVLGFGTYAFPARSQVRSVTFRARTGYSGGGSHAVRVWQRQNGYGDGAYDEAPDHLTGYAVTFTLSTRTTAPDGGAWTQAKIDALEARLKGINYFDGGTSIDGIVAGLYADVVYNEAPVVSGLSATVALDIATLSYTYSDRESDAQERRRRKVFSGTTPVVDPDNPTAPELTRLVYDSGDELTASTTGPVSSLPDGDYIAYVKVADAGSGSRWSAWSSVTFTVNVGPPPTPTSFWEVRFEE